MEVPQIQFIDAVEFEQSSSWTSSWWARFRATTAVVARWGAVHRQVVDVLVSCSGRSAACCSSRNAWLDSEYMFCVNSWVLAVLLIFSTRRGTRILRSFPVLLSGAWSASLAEWRSVHRRCFSAFLSWWSHLKTNITFTSLLYLAARYSLLRCCLRSWVDFLGALDDSQL